jgi:secondary thiamine-phosphate synthase enzyme
MIETLGIKTRSRCEFIDITADIRKAIAASDVLDGVCYLFVPHTTAGVTINEGADPDVKRDIVAALGRVFPQSGDYRHSEGNSDAHIKTALTGSSAVIFIDDGRPVLGTWQSIYFCEYDGPRQRKILVKIV